MKRVLDWLKKNHAALVEDLAALVAIESISTDGKHAKQIQKSASLTCQQMKAAGLQKTAVLQSGDSNPYAYGEWLGAPGKPTSSLYARRSTPTSKGTEIAPWELTSRGGRLYGRGAAGDKGAITAQLSAVAAFLKTHSLRSTSRCWLGGEGDRFAALQQFFREQHELLMSDVIVVCDTEKTSKSAYPVSVCLCGIVKRSGSRNAGPDAAWVAAFWRTPPLP